MITNKMTNAFLCLQAADCSCIPTKTRMCFSKIATKIAIIMQSAMNEVTSRPKVYHLRESSGARTRRVELNSRCYVRVFTLNNYSSRHLPPAGRYTQLPILMTLICHAMPRQIGLFPPTTLCEPYLYEKTRSFATTIPLH